MKRSQVEAKQRSIVMFFRVKSLTLKC